MTELLHSLRSHLNPAFPGAQLQLERWISINVEITALRVYQFTLSYGDKMN